MSAPAAAPWYASAAVLGVGRALEPPGALPHIARVLDAAAPIVPEEAELAVEALNVDATSYGVIRERCDGDAARMADCIAAIVHEHGKLQNPWTGSGGILAGRVTAVGERHWDPGLRPGDRVVPLASLIAIPLELEAVGPVSPVSPQVPVRGRASCAWRMSVRRRCAIGSSRSSVWWTSGAFPRKRGRTFSSSSSGKATSAPYCSTAPSTPARLPIQISRSGSRGRTNRTKRSVAAGASMQTASGSGKPVTYPKSLSWRYG